MSLVNNKILRVYNLIFIFGLLLILPKLCYSQNQIHLKDSTIINGRIISVNDTLVTIKTKYGILMVPMKNVRDIRFEQSGSNTLNKNNFSNTSTEKKVDLLDQSADSSFNLSNIQQKLIANKDYLFYRKAKTKYTLESISDVIIIIGGPVNYYLASQNSNKIVTDVLNHKYIGKNIINDLNRIEKKHNNFFWASFATAIIINFPSLFIKVGSYKKIMKNSNNYKFSRAFDFLGGGLYFIGAVSYYGCNRFIVDGGSYDEARRKYITSSYFFIGSGLSFIVSNIFFNQAISDLPQNLNDSKISLQIKYDPYFGSPLIGLTYEF